MRQAFVAAVFNSVSRQACAICAGSVSSSRAFSSTSSADTTLRKVGFIGLGNMGREMARNLLAAGMDVVVHDANAKQTEALVSAGARAAKHPADMSSEVDAIVTMLPSSDHVWSVYAAENGLLAPQSVRCALFIDCSTISPVRSTELARLVSAARLDPGPAGAQQSPLFVDAPVSGGVLAAKKGTLTFMVGGSELGVRRASRILSHMGSKILHMGPAGTGHAAKVCNNLVLGVCMAAVAEGLSLGQSLGMDARTLSEVFNQSSARCWSSDTYNPAPGVMAGVPASNDYNGGFMNRLMIKDLGLALEAGGSSAAMALPMCQAASTLYKEAAKHVGEDKDFSSVYQVYQKSALRGSASDSEAPTS